MYLFWLIPLLVVLALVIWWLTYKSKTQGGEPLNPPQGPGHE